MEKNEMEGLQVDATMQNEKLVALKDKYKKIALECKSEKLRDAAFAPSFIADLIFLILFPIIIWFLNDTFEFPLWLGILWLAVVAGDLILTFVFYRKLNLKGFMDEDASTAIARFKKYKKNDKTAYCIEMVVVVLLLVFTAIWGAKAFSIPVSIGISSCLCFGLLVGILSFAVQKQYFSTCDEIIDILEEKE